LAACFVTLLRGSNWPRMAWKQFDSATPVHTAPAN
jgi:hypothetical protein